jgi:hypothetical protein
MGILDEILAETVANPTRATQLLTGLHSRYCCLYVEPKDGYLQEFDGGSWKPVDGGLTVIIGEVERSGMEDWSGTPEPYVEIRPPGENPKRVFLNGVQVGGYVDDASLRDRVRSALPGDDQNLLRETLENTGFRPL